MFIRSLAWGNTPPLLLLLLLLLLLFSVTCHGNQNQQFINSCGNIHNISAPFHLQGDPSHTSNDEYYTLSCDSNNRTVLDAFSGKYYVQAINYIDQLIRLVDVGIQTNDICSSFPLSPLTPLDFLVGIGPYTVDLTASAVVFLRCENPIQSPIYISRTGYCNTGEDSANGSYSYVVPGEATLLDVADSCLVEAVCGCSSPLKGSNLTWLDVNRELEYGFEASWGGVTLCEICKKRESQLTVSKKTLSVWCGNCKLELSFRRALLGARFLFAPCVFGYLIYKFKRRHLSMFDSIEGFLQSQNHLVPISYSYSDIKRMTTGFKDKLGEGGYGSVYKGKLRSGPLVAIKMLSKPKANGQEFINKVATIGRIHHVNIVQLIGYCAERSKRALVYDFMPNGSLDKCIFSPEGKWSLSCNQMYEICIGVARGVGYLHQGCDRQILHFDIKPHNILLDENFTPKVSDFGLAKLYPTDDSIVTLTAARGTLGYMAPELFYKNIGGVSYKADVYSFGMLLMEMASRRRNWNSSANSSQIFFPSWVYDQFAEGKNIKIGETTEEESELVKKMMLVALRCIQMKPSDRPSMNKVIGMLEGNIEQLHMPPKPFLYSQSMQVENNGMNKRNSNLSGELLIASVTLVSFVLLVILIQKYRFHRQKKIKRNEHLKIERFLEDYRALKPARYTYADIKKITNQFKDKVGQGGYGIVYRGQLSNDVHVAVKILNNTKGNGEEFINEVGIIEKFASSDHEKHLLGWKKLQEIAMGIAKGIEYLHQGCDQQILHFDIKPHNILLDENLNPKITDFGQAKLCSKEQSIVSMTTARGTIGYIAPEVFSRNFGNVSYKSDIYSFGMLLLEMVGGKENFDVMVNSTNQIYFPEWIYNRLDGGEEVGIRIQDEGDAKISKKLAIVGLWCIQWYPIDRPSMHVVIQMLEGDGNTLIRPPNPFASTTPMMVTGQASERRITSELEVIAEFE
ncbi:hypothetical protein Vadar_032517 [Vaccinium darrowii]|uniref:Uncharacterized protein n=1 Tax=Vaccinium darrowii TaxID=229202 RepID=A0ACB7YRR2_9ERIC|nr:hypothetical protein Vadar_032517 [Vaccinium darrowii]